MENTRPGSQPSPIMQALVIWGSLLASQGMIVLVSQTAMTGGNGALTSPDQAAPASTMGDIPPWFFMAAAAVALLLAYVIPKLLLERVKIVKDPDGKISRTSFQKVLAPWLVRWALLETVTLFGFLNSMLSANPQAIYPFAGVSLIGFILSFPSQNKLR